VARRASIFYFLIFLFTGRTGLPGFRYKWPRVLSFHLESPHLHHYWLMGNRNDKQKVKDQGWDQGWDQDDEETEDDDDDMYTGELRKGQTSKALNLF
jgi:hypothetical protein